MLFAGLFTYYMYHTMEFRSFISKYDPITGALNIQDQDAESASNGSRSSKSSGYNSNNPTPTPLTKSPGGTSNIINEQDGSNNLSPNWLSGNECDNFDNQQNNKDQENSQKKFNFFSVNMFSMNKKNKSDNGADIIVNSDT